MVKYMVILSGVPAGHVPKRLDSIKAGIGGGVVTTERAMLQATTIGVARPQNLSRTPEEAKPPRCDIFSKPTPKRIAGGRLTS